MKKGLKLDLPSADSLFSTQAERDDMKKEKVEMLHLDVLSAFENHPFKVAQDEAFQNLVESIKENGVLIPAIARQKGDGYELIAGHRRKLAAAIAGLDTIPVLVRELTDEQAIIAMVDSNVQRENILPSEKAFAYKMKLEAIKRQAGRPKESLVQVGQNYQGHNSRNLLAQNSPDSSVQIQRFIRLTELIPQLLQMVDDKRIAFNPAVELSYLSHEQQELLYSTIEAEQATPSLSQAQKLKALSAEKMLDESTMLQVMQEQKANQKEQVRIPYDKVKAIVGRDLSPKELEDFIFKAVADYQRKLIRQQNREAR
ncbi:MAG: ParB/RepB/Spo0J family partition protein [Oscillospiraceae bacterium]|nr:ParB/RepB/Spo0J family partition protein [Oscillospiraceae bacterium]